MANQAFIMQDERRIIQAKETVEDMLEGFEIECRNNCGHPYHENRDCWGTLYTNLLALKARIEEAITVMGPEFPTEDSPRSFQVTMVRDTFDGHEKLQVSTESSREAAEKVCRNHRCFGDSHVDFYINGKRVHQPE